ncbi:MAG TPA: hypothetical protein VJ799_07870 [Nitrososphaeraceae archaeon]|nr:hypothetical protein [Nitrososphaeraceae archaeon]
MWSSSIDETCGYTDNRGLSKISTGFPCFACGTGFSSNEKRIQHLEEGLHGSMYDTGSP